MDDREQKFVEARRQLPTKLRNLCVDEYWAYRRAHGDQEPNAMFETVFTSPNQRYPVQRAVHIMPWHPHLDNPNRQVRVKTIYRRFFNRVPQFDVIEARDNNGKQWEVLRANRSGGVLSLVPRANGDSPVWEAVMEVSVLDAERSIDSIRKDLAA